MARPYKGTCLCGNVQFKITGEIHNIIYCHCSQCRKAQGSAFATNANVAITDFHFISVEQDLTGYEATPGQTKYFCKHCGSPIISKSESDPERVRIRLGTIESDITERPSAHIFVDSRANWEEICGDLPQYSEYESKQK
jgi:hypothetical protein